MPCEPTRNGPPLIGCCPPPPSNGKGIRSIRQRWGFRPWKTQGLKPEERCNQYRVFTGRTVFSSVRLGTYTHSVRYEYNIDTGEVSSSESISDPEIAAQFNLQLQDFRGVSRNSTTYEFLSYRSQQTITEGGDDASAVQTGELSEPLDPQGIAFVDRTIGDLNAFNIDTVPNGASAELKKDGTIQILQLENLLGGAYSNYRVQEDEYNDFASEDGLNFHRLSVGVFRIPYWSQTVTAIQCFKLDRVSYVRQRQWGLNIVRTDGYVVLGCDTELPGTPIYAPAYREDGYNVFLHLFKPFATNTPDACSIPPVINGVPD